MELHCILLRKYIIELEISLEICNIKEWNEARDKAFGCWTGAEC